jgi:hypothetical protein
MIETLFGYNTVDKNKNEHKKESSSQDPSPQYVQIIDSKKAQNLSILLRALNVSTEEICDALNEGNLFLLFIIFYTHTHTHMRMHGKMSDKTFLDMQEDDLE